MSLTTAELFMQGCLHLDSPFLILACHIINQNLFGTMKKCGPDSKQHAQNRSPTVFCSRQCPLFHRQENRSTAWQTARSLN